MSLWKEFAVEPELFSNYNLGSEILSGIGYEKGRFVGTLPRRWAGQVRDVGKQSNTELQQKKLVETLSKLKPLFVPRDFTIDEMQPWQMEVLKADTQKPFDAILVKGPSTHTRAIDARLGLAGENLWEVRLSEDVPRTALSLANALRFMLEQAMDIMVVDAYFDPSGSPATSKWLKPIRAIATALSSDGRLRSFSIHALNPRPSKFKQAWNPGMFAGHCRTSLRDALPRGMRVNAILWRERDGGRKFHERLIVTDLGGVAIDPGVDEGQAGESYTLRLISKFEIQEYFAKFTPATSPYDVDDEIEIIGR